MSGRERYHDGRQSGFRRGSPTKKIKKTNPFWLFVQKEGEERFFREYNRRYDQRLDVPAVDFYWRELSEVEKDRYRSEADELNRKMRERRGRQNNCSSSNNANRISDELDRRVIERRRIRVQEERRNQEAVQLSDERSKIPKFHSDLQLKRQMNRTHLKVLMQQKDRSSYDNRTGTLRLPSVFLKETCITISIIPISFNHNHEEKKLEMYPAEIAIARFNFIDGFIDCESILVKNEIPNTTEHMEQNNKDCASLAGVPPEGAENALSAKDAWTWLNERLPKYEHILCDAETYQYVHSLGYLAKIVDQQKSVEFPVDLLKHIGKQLFCAQDYVMALIQSAYRMRGVQFDINDIDMFFTNCKLDAPEGQSFKCEHHEHKRGWKSYSCRKFHAVRLVQMIFDCSYQFRLLFFSKEGPTFNIMKSYPENHYTLLPVPKLDNQLTLEEQLERCRISYRESTPYEHQGTSRPSVQEQPPAPAAPHPKFEEQIPSFFLDRDQFYGPPITFIYNYDEQDYYLSKFRRPLGY